jgi:hypothetical protein
METSWAHFGTNWMNSAPKMAPEMEASPKTDSISLDIVSTTMTAPKEVGYGRKAAEDHDAPWQ